LALFLAQERLDSEKRLSALAASALAGTSAGTGTPSTVADSAAPPSSVADSVPPSTTVGDGTSPLLAQTNAAGTLFTSTDESDSDDDRRAPSRAASTTASQPPVEQPKAGEPTYPSELTPEQEKAAIGEGSIASDFTSTLTLLGDRSEVQQLLDQSAEALREALLNPPPRPTLQEDEHMSTTSA